MDGQHIQGPPYPPRVAGVGGRPTVIPDIPILAVFIALYVGSAATNMTILQVNRRRGHKFIISGLLFGFSMARILTCSLRMGSATHPTNISLSIASNIFVNAGILIVYIVDLLFAQRIIRARQPEIGWHPLFRTAFKVLYGLVALALVLVITFIVIQFYTLDQELLRVCRDVQLAAITYLLVVAVLPLVILGVTFALPESENAVKFGIGSMKRKGFILAFSSTLCTLGAGFKAGVNWMPPRPVSDPAWYQKKAAFYIFFFALEILILYFFIAMRVDKQFHVPDGSSKRGTFSTDATEDKAKEEGPRPGSSGSDEDVAESEKEVEV